MAKLGDRRIHGDAQLKRRLPLTTGIEVAPSAQRQFLADQEWNMAAQHAGESRLRLDDAAAPA